MTMYVSKVWGFDVPCGPLVFNSEGWRNNSATKLKAGDCVILVGTKGEDTAPADQNRVLGMMEPSQQRVSTLDFPLSPETNARHFTPDGKYRWPYGLLNYRAWQFGPGLFLDAVAPREGNPFGSAAAAGIVPLTPEEEARVLAHPHHEVPLLRSFHTDRKVHGAQEARRRGAPPPTEGVRRSAMHMRRAPAFLYWFHLVRKRETAEGTKSEIVGHKIGWAFDWENRLRQFNAIALGAIGGLEYRKFAVQDLPTARLAFSAEQEMLRRFDKRRHPANREVLTGVRTDVVKEAWEELMPEALSGKVTRKSA
jgi:hypothetical protein